MNTATSDFKVLLQRSSVNCTVLHRKALDDSNNVCGNCIDNYTGSYDLTNTYCVRQAFLNVTNKVCPNICSNNGTCKYTNILSGNYVNDCSVLSSTCTATCDCDASLYGSDCSLSLNELQVIRMMQQDKLTSLSAIVSSINATSTTTAQVLTRIIPITADIVSSLAIDTSISTVTLSLTKSLLLTTLDYSNVQNVDASSLLVYTNAISSITPFTISNASTSTLIDIQDLYESYVDTLFAVFARRYQGNSTSSVSITTNSDNMITVVKTVQEDNQVSSLGLLPHNIQFTNYNNTRRILSSSSSSSSLSDNTIGISVTRAYLYDNEYNHCINCTVTDKVQTAIVSNPLRVSLNCSQYATTSSTSTIITIQNYEYQYYRELISSDEYRTNCSISNTNTTYVYTCHYPDHSNYNISITCNGNANTTITTKCPARRIVPSCQMVASSSSSYDSCRVVSYIGSTLTCSCSLCSYTNRKLSTDSITATSKATTIASYRIASVTKYVFDDYISTMSTSSSINEKTFLVTLTITLAFAILWSSVVVIVVVQAYREKRSSNKKKDSISTIGSITSVVPDSNTSISKNDDDDDDAKKTFKDYIISYFPSIYKHEVNMMIILTSIVSKHKYFSLLSNTTSSNTSSVGYTNRYINGLHLISIISANMFVLAMLFDIRSVSLSSLS